MVLTIPTLWPYFHRILTPREIGNLRDILNFWIKHHGLHWTIARLKSFSLILLGGPTKSFKVRNGFVTGPLRPIHRSASSSRKNLRLALNGLKFHGRFTEPCLKKHFEKQRESLIYTGNKDISWKEVSPFRRNWRFPPNPFRHTLQPKVPLGFLPPIYDEIKAMGYNLWYPKAFHELATDKYWGTVHCLNKDGSLKHRFIYSPHHLIQYYLFPLYYKMKVYCKVMCPSMYHRDQRLGIEKVAHLINKYNTVSSIDLTQATDFLPSENQYRLLLSLFPEEEKRIAFLNQTNTWKTPYSDFVITYGQAMGLQVSFLSFSIYLYELILEEFPNHDFALVGDDVVLPGTSFYLDELGFRISSHKSLYGKPYGEFCGTVIDHLGDLIVKRQKTNPLITVQALGRQSLFALYPKWVARKAYAVSLFPEPYGLGQSKIWDRVSPEHFYDFMIEMEREVIPYPVLTKSQRKAYEQWWVDAEIASYLPYVDASAVPPLQSFEWSLIYSRQNLLCIIDQINKTGDVSDIVKRLYGLPYISKSTLGPLATDPDVQHVDTNPMRSMCLMLKKAKRVLIPALAGIPAIALAATLTSGSITWNHVLSGVSEQLQAKYSTLYKGKEFYFYNSSLPLSVSACTSRHKTYEVEYQCENSQELDVHNCRVISALLYSNLIHFCGDWKDRFNYKQ